MRLCDPHIHLIARVTDDYERMAQAGIVLVVEPSFWLGQLRRRAGSLFDYYDLMLEWETKRASQHGIDHYTAIALNPSEANRRELAEEVLAGLAPFLDHPRTVAVGEIGFDNLTDAEEDAFRRQVRMAGERSLPVMIHLPHRNKVEGCRRTLAVLREEGADLSKVIVDHSVEETTGMILEAGCWAGHTVYPKTKLTPERAANIVEEHGVERIMVNSSADWGPSDPLSVPATVAELRRRGFAEERIETLVWNNPVTFFGASGRLAAKWTSTV